MTFELRRTDINAFYMYENFRYRDVRLDVRAENRGNINNEFGLVCRYTQDGWYEFSTVSKGGRWVLYAAVPSSDGLTKYYGLGGGSTSTLIKDENGANEYGMICKGNKIQLYINGT